MYVIEPSLSTVSSGTRQGLAWGSGVAEWVDQVGAGVGLEDRFRWSREPINEVLTVLFNNDVPSEHLKEIVEHEERQPSEDTNNEADLVG